LSKNKFFRVNEQIRVPEVFLVDEAGTPIGRISNREALDRARQAELDLVEVSPNTNPPVCKIVDFGKFKYELEKQARKQRARNKGQDMKEIRLSFRIEKNDLGIKLKKARSFLEKQHKLKVTLRLHGRELSYQDLAKQKILTFIDQLKDIAKVEQELKKLGKNYFVLLAPDLGKKLDEKSENSPGSPDKTDSSTSQV